MQIPHSRSRSCSPARPLGDLHAVSAVTDLQWDLIELAARAVDLRWRIIVHTGKVIDLDWRVLTTTSTDMSLDWDVLPWANSPRTGLLLPTGATRVDGDSLLAMLGIDEQQSADSGLLQPVPPRPMSPASGRAMSDSAASASTARTMLPT